MRKKGLGKGLDVFFEEKAELSDAPSGVIEIKLTEVEPNRAQPRKTFDTEKIEALAESIKEHGIIQPIVVTKNENGMYTIVAGERRWRAAKLLKLKTVPVLIKEYSALESAQIALIENLQREDLNAIEEALGYRALMDEYGMTQEEVSEKIGKSRSAVANSLRLLSLDDAVKEYVERGSLSGGHARALLAIEDKAKRAEIAEKVISEGLSVRAIEALAKSTKTKKLTPPRAKTQMDIECDAIATSLSEHFGTKVRLVGGAKKGKIEIEYYSDRDLDRLLEMLNK